MTTAIYTRVSTEDQAQGYSLDSQLAACRAIAQERGYSIVLEASDEATGSTLERPGLTRVRDAVRAGDVRRVLVFDPDRLTRSFGHLLWLEEEFSKSGAVLEFGTSGVAETPEQRLLLQARGMVAEYERVKILERTSRGRRAKAQAGLWVGGPAPYGYDLADGHLTINMTEAQCVRAIFERMAGGESIRGIRRWLDTTDWQPWRGGDQWQTSSIGRILRAELYVGRAWWNRRRRGGSEATTRTMRPESEWMLLPVPAIVSDDLWRRVQDRLERNRVLISGRPSHTYLLRGMCRCAECGARMGGEFSKGYRRYRCLARCGATSPQADVIEAAVWSAVSMTIGSAESLGAIVGTHLEAIRGKRRNLSALDRRAALLRTKEDRGTRAIMHATSDAEEAILRDELQRIRRQRQDVEQQIALVRGAEGVLASVESARREIARRLRVVGRDAQLRREFLIRLVREVKVGTDGIIVVCKLSTSVEHCGQFAFELRRAI